MYGISSFGRERKMGQAARTLVVMALSLVLCGCGTITTFVDAEPAVYGGVRKDISWMTEGGPGSSSGPLFQLKEGDDPRGVLILLGLLAMEPAMSFVADTLTLPITIPVSRASQ
jgi:uncharacterized protein YceK